MTWRRSVIAPIRLGLQALFSLPLLLILSIAATAQTPMPPLPVDPTLLKDLLSSEERSLIAATHGTQKLVDAYLDISDKHLRAAGSDCDTGDFIAAEKELDIYNKAAAEAANTAFSGSDKNKLGKRIEQRLYIQIRTLEAIDRRFPADAVGYPDAALEHTRQLRAHALNQTLAVGQVLTESKDGKKEQVEKKEKEDDDPASKPSGGPPVKKPHYFLSPAAAVRRPQVSGDYLTEQENEEVREAQEIDSRTKVFMKIAGRRLALLTHPGVEDSGKKPNKKSGKDSDQDSDQEEQDQTRLAKLSRAVLLRHYSQAIQEVMDKLDDAHERNPKSSALTKALVALRDSTDKQLGILHSLEASAKEQAESDALRQAIKDAEEANKGAHQALSGKS
jgi:hypothetical protein